MIYRLGFASDHAEARQLVRHGHFRINGRRVDIPSYLVKANELIEVREPSKKIARIVDSMGAVERRGVPQWLELNKETFQGRVKSLPAREDVTPGSASSSSSSCTRSRQEESRWPRA